MTWLRSNCSRDVAIDLACAGGVGAGLLVVAYLGGSYAGFW